MLLVQTLQPGWQPPRSVSGSPRDAQSSALAAPLVYLACFEGCECRTAIVSEHPVCTLFGFLSHGRHVTFFIQLPSRAAFRGEHGGVSTVPLGAALLLDVGGHRLAEGAVAAGVIEHLGRGPLSHGSFWDGAGRGSVGHGHPLFCSKTPISVHKLVLSTVKTHSDNSHG